METFIHPKITGYRQLTEQEVALMNEGKELAEQVSKYLTKVYLSPNTDQRWVSIATTQLQQGFMAATRSIARPTTF